MKAGWENWQGGFIRVGYPPPCQPPLVAAGSSSPSSSPKIRFQIVDFLFPRSLLPSGRVSVHLPPKWLDSRVVQFNSPKVVSLIPVSILSPKSSFRLVGRFISEEMIGSNHGGPFPHLSEESCGAVSVHGRSVSIQHHERCFLVRFPPVASKPKLFHQAVVCNRGCPEELLLLHLPAKHSHWYFHNKLWPSLYHTSKGCMADSLPKLRIILWVWELLCPKTPIFLNTSIALSPEFMTNTLLGLSRPVGKGPRGFPRKPSTTP